MTALPIADNVAKDALHGSFCPKMCTFACPVTEATGRDDAVPWSFHREVSDLATGRQEAGDIGHRLDLCNGCLACQRACTYEQDVPSQVVVGRSVMVASGHVLPGVADAIAAVAADNSPYGTPRPAVPDAHEGAGTAVVVGCQDTTATLAAVDRIARSAMVPIRFVVPAGCCGGVLRDLGASAEASTTDASGHVVDAVEDHETVVVLDTGCMGEFRPAADGRGPAHAPPIHVVTWLDRLRGSGQLTLRDDPPLGLVTWHDPAHLARRHGVIEPPRSLLRAMGASIVEPEGTREHTVSAGVGLGMELLDPEAAAATARRRAAQLGATGAPVISVGSGVIGALRSTGLEVRDLVEVVADHLA